MKVSQAQQVVESLRKGIPPSGFIHRFTVGRNTEIRKLSGYLKSPDGTVLLLKANYGSGKSHLLKFIREEALAQNYAVSVVALDSNSAVRFNRMDQIFGSICRNIEIPHTPECKGIRFFFDFASQRLHDDREENFWNELSNNGKWDLSEKLDSPALFVAFRAYITGHNGVQALVEDWLYNSWEYKAQRKKLYEELVGKLRQYFRDPRSDIIFYQDQTFSFDIKGYDQSWAALRDLNSLAMASGLKGLIVLFDEFEDVITNLNNVMYQEAAFFNLFKFYSGKQFPGKTFYAVTPEFAKKCKITLREKGRFDFDYSRFDALPVFEMSPLELKHLLELGKKIVTVHARAYGWNGKAVSERHIESWMADAIKVPVQDRTRRAIVKCVERLDEHL